MTVKRVAKAAPKKPAKSKPSAPPEVMEDLLRQFAAMMGVTNISREDLKALVNSLEGTPPDGELSYEKAETKFEAQELAWDAMEAVRPSAARKLAKRALELDPDCVDALVVLSDVDAKTQTEHIEGLKKAVAAGKRSLGAKFFKENKGYFWGLIDTRPYMRAMETLAGEMASAGMRPDAISVYQEMLELNPNDNQGVRDPLLGLYLALGDAAGAKRLLKQYKGDGSACFAWGLVLERLLARDHAKADAALQKAIQTNRFVALHLTGREPLPKGLPAMYSRGSVEEAMLCQLWLGAAWAAHPEALFWVCERCAATGMGAVPSKAALKIMKVPNVGVQ